MQLRIFNLPKNYFSIPDIIVLSLLASVVYGLFLMSVEWRTEYHPFTHIDLSPFSLPKYALLSAVRGFIAFGISLICTLFLGYLAARSKTAEKIIIPALDIFQSIPVLGFLPALVLGLLAMFPKSNFGLELAAILMIFSGQVWNMALSFYASLKSIPPDFLEASTVIGLNLKQRFIRLELPFSAVNLAWNGLLSMAGGWFFLSACESFTLGNREFRLPGIGAYMGKATEKGDTSAMLLGLATMILLILAIDLIFWRPILSWVQRFRLEGVPGVAPTEPVLSSLLKESNILRLLKILFRKFSGMEISFFRGVFKKKYFQKFLSPAKFLVIVPNKIAKIFHFVSNSLLGNRSFLQIIKYLLKYLFFVGMILLCAGAVFKLGLVLTQVEHSQWVILFRNTLWTFFRVILALFFSSLWAVPIGIWIGISSKRVKFFQPIIQICTSFPAPMLYPIAMAFFLKTGVSFDWGSVVLMLLGAQWYILFNVLAGAMSIPIELNYALEIMNSSWWDKWKSLYLPSVFPALITGWVSAAGGAWNASIVSEVMLFRGTIFETGGLGATIRMAAAQEKFELLAASLTIMISMVIILNRVVWAKMFRLAHSRFRMDIIQ